MKKISHSDFHEELIPHATLNVSSLEIEPILGFQFEKDCDELGEFNALYLQTSHGQIFALKAYLGHPAHTTTIYLQRRHKQVQEITNILGEIVRRLGLKAENILWQRKDTPDA